MPKVKTYNFNNDISYLNPDPESEFVFASKIYTSKVTLHLMDDDKQDYTITFEIPDLGYNITYNMCGEKLSHTNAKAGQILNASTIHSHIADAFREALPKCSHSVDSIDETQCVGREGQIFFHSGVLDTCINRTEHHLFGYDRFPALGEVFWASAEVVE